MNVEIGTEVVQFSEKEYINGIFVAVYYASGGGGGGCTVYTVGLGHVEASPSSENSWARFFKLLKAQ